MRFSIVTICFNAKNEIRQTIKSVLSQSFTDYEYIVIDGASTDGTQDIVRELFKETKTIKTTLVSEPDCGISDAFNKGIRLAKGDYVWLINAGDELIENSLSVISKSIEDSNGDLFDVIYGNLLWKDTINNIEYVRKSNKKYKNIFYKMCILHPCTLIKKSSYELYGDYRVDFKISMDRELLCRFVSKGASFKYLNIILTIMSSGGVSDSFKKQDQREYEREQIIKIYGLSQRKAKRIRLREDFFNYFKKKIKRYFKFLYRIKGSR